MAVTIAAADGAPWPNPRSGKAFKRFPAKITGDSSYPTGGWAITPASVGLARIDQVNVGLSTDGTVQAVWDGANSKLKVFSTNAAPVVQVANATDLSTKVFPADIVGV